MKIGILTFHRSYNYGAVLQAYALKTYLSQKGHDASIIDYWPKYHQRMYHYVKAENVFRRNLLKGAFYLYKRLLSLSVLKRRRQVFETFQYEYLGLNRDISCSEIESQNEHYDWVIYGSDQIWRKYLKSMVLRYTGFDPAYWGYCISAKKMSYAASLGNLSVVDKEDEIFIKDRLRGFSFVSVREKGLKNMLNSVGINDVEQVIDPIFLLSAEEWSSIIPNSFNPPKFPYLLYYRLTSSTGMDRYVSLHAKKYGLQTIVIDGNSMIDPGAFVGYFKNATFVCTTSFHGTAFAIRFGRQFLASGMVGNSDRVRTLCAEIGLLDRYVDSWDNSIDLREIDYKFVFPRLECYIEDSKSFIDQIKN